MSTLHQANYTAHGSPKTVQQEVKGEQMARLGHLNILVPHAGLQENTCSQYVNIH